MLQTGPHAHQHVVTLTPEQRHATHLRVEHHARVITEEEQVAACPDMKKGQPGILRAVERERLTQFVGTVIGDQHPGQRLDAKRIIRQQRAVFAYHHDINKFACVYPT